MPQTEHVSNINKAEKHVEVVKKKFPGWNNLHFGRPKATEVYTVEKLEALGMIGLYGNRIDEISIAINHAISPEKEK